MKFLALFILLFSFRLQAAEQPAPPPQSHATLKGVTDLLIIDRTCKDLSRVDRELHDYYSLLKSPASTPDLVNAKALALKSWIGSVAGHEDSCRQSVLSLYLVESLYLLTSRIDDLTKDDGQTALDPVRYPMSVGWAFYAVVALNQHHVTFTDGQNLEAVSDHQHHSLLGTYACENMAVTLNAAQTPLNVAATMSHELFHLFYDRFSMANYGAKKFELRINRYSIVLEESLASLLAAFLQREFSHTVLAPQLREAKLQDLTFFSKDGPLEQFSRAMINDNGGRYKYRFEQMAEVAVFMTSDLKSYTTCDPAKTGTCAEIVHPLYRTPFKSAALYDLIKQTYFEEKLTNRDRARLQASRIEKTLYSTDGFEGKSYSTGHYTVQDIVPVRWPLAWWAAASAETLHAMSRADIPFFEVGFDHVGLWDDDNGKMPFDIQDYLKDPKAFSRSYFDPMKPSPICEGFLKVLHQGKLVKYLGAKPRAPKKPNPPTKPSGGDGGRPSGGDGGRPTGGDGGRPAGGDGGRPAGGDGGKPAAGDGGRPASAIRPCISLDGQL